MLDLDRAARDIGAGRRGPNVSFGGVTTDSRQVAHGDLFVALRGERHDGHAFVRQALDSGAVAAMVDDARAVADHAVPLILVDDTLQARGRLAAAWRNRFTLPLVAVTGSNGKTTVKEMLAAILRAHVGEDAVLESSGNLNNAIGMPLMLLRLRSHHRHAVLEMGMNHLGEIRYLTTLASPTAALVNNAGTAHIGELGSRESIAQAKGEIYEGLSAGGVALINADDDFAEYWRGLNRGRRVVDFGIAATAQVRGSVAGDELSVSTPRDQYRVRVPVPGLHNLRNALAACAAAYALEVPTAAVIWGFATFEGAKGRLQSKPGKAGARVIDDTYNANPDSMRAAIAVLAQAAPPRVLVMGDMGELGGDAGRMHEELGVAAREAGIERLFTLGELAARAAQAFGRGADAFQDLDALCAQLIPLLSPASTVLVKGSRFMRMERVVNRLVDGAGADEGGH